jgi:hypothetical protein
MSSTITNYSSLINTAFPVPGADNDTQGFRNNFGNIRDALTAASTEISDIQVEQLAVISQLNSFVSPENVVATTVLTSIMTATTIKASGSITAGSFIGDGSQLTGISIGNTFGTLNVSGELYSGNTFITGQLSATSILSPGTVQAGQFVGDGSLLTNLPTPSISNIQNFNITGTITSRDITVSNLVTAGGFSGDGSRLTNVPLPSTTSRLRVTNNLLIDDTATIRKLYAQTAEVDLSLSVSGNVTVGGSLAVAGAFIGDGSQLTGVLVDRGSVYDAGVVSSNSYTFDYANGQFQTITIDTTSQNNTDFKITNWPEAGTYGYIQIQIQLTGTPPGPAPVVSVFAATTYGQTSTVVDVLDVDGAGRLLGTLGMARGYGIYTSNIITPSSTPITYIDKVVSPTRLSVVPPANLISGTDYHIAANPNSDLPYGLELIADTGQTIKPSLAAGFASVFVELFNTVVCEAYSVDGGATIYVKSINLYDFDENSV